MSWRVILSIILVAIGVGVMVVVSGLLGALLGSGFLILALVVWILPPDVFERSEKASPRTVDPTVSRVSRIMLGIGGGLLLAWVTAVFLPETLSWLMIGVGVGLIAWYYLRR